MRLSRIGLSLATFMLLLSPVQQAIGADQKLDQTYPREFRVHRPSISFLWDPATKSVVAMARLRCLTSSARNLRNTLTLAVDAETRTLSINGYFFYTLLGRGVKKDCSKRTAHRLSLDGVEPGSYRVKLNDRDFGQIELGDEAITPKFRLRVNPNGKN